MSRIVFTLHLEKSRKCCCLSAGQPNQFLFLDPPLLAFPSNQGSKIENQSGTGPRPLFGYLCIHMYINVTLYYLSGSNLGLNDQCKCSTSNLLLLEAFSALAAMLSFHLASKGKKATAENCCQYTWPSADFCSG